VKREADLQLMFRLTWFATPSDFNTEVNNGRGPVDFKISRGFKDKTLVEFKLASNSKLKQNIAKQLEVYEEANQTKKAIKVILYFNETELEKTKKVLKELGLKEGKTIVLIDASNNKPSASTVKL
jgi:predicted molibdopterin-dependent oxidoreductase YjgC